MIILKMLTLDDLTPKLFGVADDKGELTVIRLCTRLNSVSFFLRKLPSIAGIFLMVDAVKVLPYDLPVLRLRRLLDQSESFREGPVLQPDVRYFSRLSRFSFLGIESVGRRKGSCSLGQLSSKLSCHGLTGGLSKGRLHGVELNSIVLKM